MQIQPFIDGAWAASALGSTLPVIGPATEAVIHQIPGFDQELSPKLTEKECTARLGVAAGWFAFSAGLAEELNGEVEHITLSDDRLTSNVLCEPVRTTRPSTFQNSSPTSCGAGI